MRKKTLLVLLALFCLSFVIGCGPTETLAPSVTPALTATLKPSQTPTLTPTASPVPATNTPPPIQPSLTPTVPPVYIDALYWQKDLQVPVILYHRFLPLNAKESSKTKMLLIDFQDQLQAFYDSGYSLIPIEKWLAGDIHLPVGRRPMILTMDDLFFADQIFLDPDGTPSTRSGLGVLWDFFQKHPDFGFSAGLFYNLGDKYYGNYKTDTWFLVSDGWQDALARAIVWCIEHDALPFNHTYLHSSLDQLEALAIQDELARNDKTLRKMLARVSREDLISRLDNYIALPYGVWPASKGLTNFMLAYRDPEDHPVKAVFEAGYYYQEQYLPAPFESGFDRYKIPRITTNTHKSVNFLVENRDRFPLTQTCRLGPINGDRTQAVDDLKAMISAQISARQCQEGIYRVENFFFDFRAGKQALLWTVPPVQFQK